MILPSRVLRNGSRYVLSNRLRAIGKAPLVSPTLIRVQCLATIRAVRNSFHPPSNRFDGHPASLLPVHLVLLLHVHVCQCPCILTTILLFLLLSLSINYTPSLMLCTGGWS